MKKQEKKTKDNIENISKVIENKKQIPKTVKEKINVKIFENIIFASIVFIYLNVLNIGMSNIPTENYIMDLKIFSMILLVVTIILIECGYKRDEASLWFHGFEVMLTGIFTIYLIYMYMMYYNVYGNIVFTFSIMFMLYYFAKVIFMKRKIVREYGKSLGDIDEIVKNKR